MSIVAQVSATSPYRISVSIRRLTLFLGCVVASLVTLHLALHVIHYRIHDVPHVLMRLCDLDEENNVPSWYSWVALLLVSALFFVIAAVKRRAGDRDARLWLVLAIGFLVMSLDEDASIHESLNTIADQISGNAAWNRTSSARIQGVGER